MSLRYEMRQEDHMGSRGGRSTGIDRALRELRAAVGPWVVFDREGKVTVASNYPKGEPALWEEGKIVIY